MNAMHLNGLPVWLTAYPAAAVRLDGAGTVVASNGRLEEVLERSVLDMTFADLLDEGSSGLTWSRDRAAAAGGGFFRELVFARRDGATEPRPFAMLGDGEGGVWLLEQRHDPRLDQLRTMVADVNSALAAAQRELLIEQRRLRRALSELERSNRSLDEFAHVVSHDLKAPLRAIANYAARLEEEHAAALRDDGRAAVGRIADRVQRLRALIEGALAYARAGRQHAEPELVDTGELAREVALLLDPPRHVDVHVADGMPQLFTRRVPLQQVLLNLLSNAVRHAAMGAHGTVAVSARRAGEYWEFEVADNGPGIPADLQQRIWGLFQTLEPEESAAGTGIGLAVVKQIVESQAGTIRVESDAGAGARFIWLWPARPAGAQRTLDT